MQRGELRPGLARADRQPYRRFVAIVRDLGVDEEGTDAFVHAYLTLPAADRRRLADAVAKDLGRAGHDPGRALAALFLCEEDPTVLDHLWRTLRGAVAAPATLAAESGDEDAGGLLLAVPEHDSLSTLFITWRAETTTIEVARMASSAEAMAHLRLLAGTDRARQSDSGPTIDLAAERLWRHRLRGGSLPAGIGRFAPLFSA